eukprot:4240917-Pleurochrysis_carterae.AAC.1
MHARSPMHTRAGACARAREAKRPRPPRSLVPILPHSIRLSASRSHLSTHPFSKACYRRSVLQSALLEPAQAPKRATVAVALVPGGGAIRDVPINGTAFRWRDYACSMQAAYCLLLSLGAVILHSCEVPAVGLFLAPGAPSSSPGVGL